MHLEMMGQGIFKVGIVSCRYLMICHARLVLQHKEVTSAGQKAFGRLAAFVLIPKYIPMLDGMGPDSNEGQGISLRLRSQSHD